MSKSPAFGGALQYSIDQLGGMVTEQDSAPSVANSVAVAVDGNGDRVGLTIVNTGAADVFLTVAGQAVGGTSGIRIPANGGFMAINVRDDFTLCTRRWYCNTSSGSSSLYVLEIIRITTTGGKP